MPAAIASFSLSPADSARAVAQVYSVSLLATLPLVAAGGTALALHRASAATRALVWRGAAVGLVLIYLGQTLPIHWMSWALGEPLASPLIAIGRVQVSAPSIAGSSGVTLIRVLLFVYATGVVAVLGSLVRDWLAARAVVRRARAVTEPSWRPIVDDLCNHLGIRRDICVLRTTELRTAATCGAIQPVVLLPDEACSWSEHRARAVLLHELAHVKGRDVLFALLARVGCALFWFHPGAWLVARELHDECETACDDRVIAGGVRPSDYAELLADTVNGATRPSIPPGLSGAIGFVGAERRGVRGRLRAILDFRRDRRPPTRQAIAAVMVLTFAATISLSGTQLSPTRDVLTRLMGDTRWEARAYAVLGLARRPDSVAVVRRAAVFDPSPRVRAVAEAALHPH